MTTESVLSVIQVTNWTEKITALKVQLAHKTTTIVSITDTPTQTEDTTTNGSADATASANNVKKDTIWTKTANANNCQKTVRKSTKTDTVSDAMMTTNSMKITTVS